MQTKFRLSVRWLCFAVLLAAVVVRLAAQPGAAGASGLRRRADAGRRGCSGARAGRQLADAVL